MIFAEANRQAGLYPTLRYPIRPGETLTQADADAISLAIWGRAGKADAVIGRVFEVPSTLRFHKHNSQREDDIEAVVSFVSLS